jgi:hypothetical protein
MRPVADALPARRATLRAPFVVGLSLSSVQDTRRQSVRSLLHRVGLNTGNLLFIHVLRRVLDYPDLAHGETFDPAEVAERHDCIVVPAANWLQPRHNFSALAASIEATALPCVVIGIGAQAPHQGGIPRLQDGLVRLMKVASERSHSISTRGEYSAEVLRHHGIENISVTGCPSLLWKVTQPCRVAKPARAVERVVVNSSRGAPSEMILSSPQATHRMNRLLPRIALERGLDFVAQAELPDIYYALGRTDEDRHIEEIPNYLARLYGTQDLGRLNRFLLEHVKVFFNVESWLEYLRSQDFVFGSRLHGVIAALIAGTPATLVTHDARTAEMAKQAAIPSVAADDISQDIDWQRLYDACDIDGFNRRSSDYYASFATFFEAHGLRHRLVIDGTAHDL